MAKNANVSDGTLPIDTGKKKKAIVERRTPKRKVIMEPKSTSVIKRPRAITSIEDVKPVRLGSNDKRKRYLNPKTGNMVLWKSPLHRKARRCQLYQR